MRLLNIRNSILLVYLFLCLVTLNANAYASVSPNSPNCHFLGKVQSISLRKEPGQGMSMGKTHRYIDITIKIIKDESLSIGGCSKEKIRVLQMRPSLLGVYDFSLPKKGSCVKGHSNFSGDGNFTSGNWLTIGEVLPEEGCNY